MPAIPHFYNAFYVCRYVTALSEAIALARRVLLGDTAERDAYFGFLKLRDHVFPLDALKEAGADLSSPLSTLKTVSHYLATYFGSHRTVCGNSITITTPRA